VTLRALRAADAASLLQLLTDEEVTRFISPPPTTVEGFERFIAWADAQRAAGQYLCYAVVPRNGETAVGIIQVRPLTRGFETAEWGFAVGRPYWGTGLFVDAADLVQAFAFETLSVHRLEARVVVANGRGNGVLRKLGASRKPTCTPRSRGPAIASIRPCGPFSGSIGCGSKSLGREGPVGSEHHHVGALIPSRDDAHAGEAGCEKRLHDRRLLMRIEDRVNCRHSHGGCTGPSVEKPPRRADRFKPGDIVALTSGGPLMTVTNVEGGRMWCEWFDGKVQARFFDETVLRSASLG